ncbi:uncharacterized protein LOC117514410 [Thalassophryne amazonica]|uniref:uncharacterized protein LOC117514410 n=1 Tax=Thalassophryne amazonica TaxID=390379 RepID=UPI001470F3AA|nr:uncharacterized protein LOC117514410 [Thalassophryne amazonica]
MTAASPVCSPAFSQSTQSSQQPACIPACHRHLRKGKNLQTRLHLRSAPGVWLLLGVGVVLVGTSVAVAGYISAAPKPLGGRSGSHIEKMKLAGPVVMGVGLFIFICAATLLYENRDRQVLRLETPDEFEDLKVGNEWEESQERWECKDGQQGYWGPLAHTLPLSSPNWDPPAPRLPCKNIHKINRRLLPPPPPDAEGKGVREEVNRKQEGAEEQREGGSTLLTHVLHHKEPTPHPPSPCPSQSHSSVSSRSCNSSEINFNIRMGSPVP